MQSYRFAFAALGGIIVSVVALPLTKILGAGDLQKGYFLAMVIMGGMSTIMFFLCFALTKEHYVKEVDKSHNLRGIYQELLIIIKDFNWRCIFSLNIASLIAGILKTGGAIYFVSYYMKSPDLVSTVLVIILCTRFVGAMSTTLLYKNFDRVRAYKLTLVIQAVILVALFTVPAESVLMICGVICLIHFIDSSSAPLQWSLLSDIIDNVEKKSNRSLSGLVFSTNLFAIKIGIAVGGAIIGWLLTFGGYIGNAAMQTDLAIMTVRLIFTIIPAVFILIMFFIMQQYRSYAA